MGYHQPRIDCNSAAPAPDSYCPYPFQRDYGRQRTFCIEGVDVGAMRPLCERIVSGLPEDLEIMASYFTAGRSVFPESSFQYKIIVATPRFNALPIGLHPVPSLEELSDLECLLLRETIQETGGSSSFAFATRFGPAVSRGPDGTMLSALEILSSQDCEFMNNVAEAFSVACPRYQLFDHIPSAVGPPLAVWYLVKPYADRLRGEQGLDKECVKELNGYLQAVVRDVGLAKVLALPELEDSRARRELAFTTEETQRLDLVQHLVWPRYNTRPAIRPHSIARPWVTVPARLFVYGPILDLVNTLREKRLVKVCLNCGKLFLPWIYKQDEHVYCSKECRKQASEKRRYRKEKETRGAENSPQS